MRSKQEQAMWKSMKRLAADKSLKRRHAMIVLLKNGHRPNGWTEVEGGMVCTECEKCGAKFTSDLDKKGFLILVGAVPCEPTEEFLAAIQREYHSEIKRERDFALEGVSRSQRQEAFAENLVDRRDL